MAYLLSLHLPRFSPSPPNTAVTKKLSPHQDKRSFQFPFLRKIERRLKGERNAPCSKVPPVVFKEIESSSELGLSSAHNKLEQPHDDDRKKQGRDDKTNKRSEWTRRRSTSLRLLSKRSLLSKSVDLMPEGMRTTTPRRKSSTRIAHHMGCSQHQLSRMTSNAEIVVSPHQARIAATDDEDDDAVAYIQLEILPSPRKQMDQTKPSRNRDEGMESKTLEQEDLKDDNTKIKNDQGIEKEELSEAYDDELSTVSDPLAYLPAISKQQRHAASEYEFERDNRSISSAPILASFLTSKNFHASKF